MRNTDDFVRAFAEGLVDRAGLGLASPAKERYVTELEQAIHQRLGVATCERLGEDRVQNVVKQFLHGEPTEDLEQELHQSTGQNSHFIQRELTAFAVEFLQAVGHS